MATKLVIDEETKKLNELRKRLLERIEDASRLSSDRSMEIRWKASGIVQGLCSGYAALARLKNG